MTNKIAAFGTLTRFSLAQNLKLVRYQPKSSLSALSQSPSLWALVRVRSISVFVILTDHKVKNKQTNNQIWKYEKRGSKGQQLTAIVLTLGMTAFGSLTIFSVPTKSENCTDLQQPRPIVAKSTKTLTNSCKSTKTLTNSWKSTKTLTNSCKSTQTLTHSTNGANAANTASGTNC